MLESQGLPGNIKVPFVYFGVDNSKAGTFNQDNCIIVFGQKLPDGTANSDVPVEVFGNQVELFGAGSMLSSMIDVIFQNNPTVQIYAIAQDAVGSASEWEISVGMPDDGNGNPLTALAQGDIVRIVIAGKVYQITAELGDTEADIATALAQVINDDQLSAVVATAAGGLINLTAKNSGKTAGRLDIRTDYQRLGVSQSSVLLSVSQTATGAGDPDVSASIAAMPEECCWIAFPYCTISDLSRLVNEMSDQTGRWNALEQLYGHAFSFFSGNPAARIAHSGNFNSQHLSIAGLEGSPTPDYIFTAAISGKAALHLHDAPELSRPLQTVSLSGVLAPDLGFSESTQVKQALLCNGAATLSHGRDGVVRIERLITTYQENAFGVSDNSYLDVQTLAQLQYIIKYVKNRLTTLFPRHSLKPDGSFLPPGASAITPEIMRGYVASFGRELANLCVIEDVEEFINRIEVDADPNNPGCLNINICPALVDQFRIAKVLVQFYQNYPTVEAA